MKTISRRHYTRPNRRASITCALQALSHAGWSLTTIERYPNISDDLKARLAPYSQSISEWMREIERMADWIIEVTA